MAFKVVIFCAVLAVCRAGVLPTAHHAYDPVLVGGHEQIEHHAPANYEFGYSVHDSHTGDIKSQHEVRHGDNVQGQYSLIEPDGNRRTVDYSADAHNGFNAHVSREGVSHHPAQIAVAHNAHVAPVAAIAHHAGLDQHAAIAHHAAVAHQAAPVATIAHHAAPVATIAHHAAAPIAIAHATPLAGAHHATTLHAQHAAPIAFAAHASPLAATHTAAIFAPALTQSVHHTALATHPAHLGAPLLSSHTVHHDTAHHLALHHH